MRGDREEQAHGSELPAPPVQEPRLKRPARQGDDEQELHKTGLAYSIPSAMAAPVIVLTLAGAWMDKRWGWGGVATITGAVLGLISGMLNALRLANRLDR